MTESNVIALNMSRERPASTMSRYPMLLVLLLSILVSNLMAVLCGERDTQPVVNTGTLYQ